MYAFDLSVRAAYLDDTRAYFNGPSVFLLPEGREDAPCIVEIVRPEGAAYAGWRVATTLPPDDAPERGFGTYRAADYDELIDHPVEMGEFAWARFDVRGVPHEIAITGRHDADLSRLARDLSRICDWQIALFGEAPFDRYLFQVIAVGEGVTAFKKGDRVMGRARGSFAEYTAMSIEQAAPAPEPELLQGDGAGVAPFRQEQ